MIAKVIFVLAPVLAILGIFVMAGWSARRKGAGGMSTTVVGATYNMLSEDKRRAAEIVVKQNAGAKLEEQSSDGDESPGDSKG